MTTKTFNERIAALEALQPGWDGNDGLPPTYAAIHTAAAMTPVPMSHGGVQIELHAGGVDLEIEIEPTGTVTAISMTRARN